MTLMAEPSPDDLNALFPAPEPDRSTLGGLIRATRRAQGMSQKELAYQIRVSFKHISDIENNRLKTSPSIDTLRALANILDLSFIDLQNLADHIEWYKICESRKRHEVYFEHGMVHCRQCGKVFKSVEDADKWKDTPDAK